MAHVAGLNAAQLRAVTSVADVVQVLAPPGSGKTKTLTSRVAHLLVDRNYLPWEIICLTFTNKSAREMKDRLGKLIGEDVSRNVIVGTFHSVCRRYLASHGHLIQLRKGFTIATTSKATAIIDRIVERLKLGINAEQAKDRISICKAKKVGLEQLRRNNIGKQDIQQDEFVKLYENYEDYLETENMLDYDDLLLCCDQLLKKHPECVSNIKAVLIDEFQDTNPIQFDLMALFAQSCQRVLTVGDPDQSIYGWRSARVTNLSNMLQLWPNTVVINLENNYRTAAAILGLAQLVIEQDLTRPRKQLITTHRNGTPPVLRILPTAEIEGGWIASEIKRCMALSAGLLTPGDFAVLLRSTYLSSEIQSALDEQGIPYRRGEGHESFDRSEVEILLDYLRVIAQPNNSDALSRIINVPSRRIGEKTVDFLLEEAAIGKCALWSVICKWASGEKKAGGKVRPGQIKGLGVVVGLINNAHRKLETSAAGSTPRELLEHVIKKVEFKEYLTKRHKKDSEVRWKNVEKLIAAADELSLDQSDATDRLSRFLVKVALASQAEPNEDSEVVSTSVSSLVTISTMHAAKGLEWPVIFIPGCYQGSIPHYNAEDEDEERRLLYVAMTRAKAMLYMSYPKISSRGTEAPLSSFLDSAALKPSLTDQGPPLDYHAIESIASILGRTCPSPQRVTEALSTIDHHLDDRWPLDGTLEETGELGDVQKSPRRAADEGFKRGDASHTQASHGGVTSTLHVPTTMTQRGSFTHPASALGITTAAALMQAQQAAPAPEIPQTPRKRHWEDYSQAQTQAQTQTRHAIPLEVHESRHKRPSLEMTQKPKKPKLSQTRISAFFGARSMPAAAAAAKSQAQAAPASASASASSSSSFSTTTTTTAMTTMTTAPAVVPKIERASPPADPEVEIVASGPRLGLELREASDVEGEGAVAKLSLADAGEPAAASAATAAPAAASRQPGRQRRTLGVRRSLRP